MIFKRFSFALRRPWLFLRGLTVSRDDPGLERLADISDPERFVWAVLPHAARTFSPSIVALPYRRAIAAAVGYLYARMLDTYEDLEGELGAKLAGLAGFAQRFDVTPPAPAPEVAAPIVRDDRDRVHLLLIERAALVDEVFATLSREDKARIIEMIADMSAGMQRFASLLDRQSGALEDDEQLEDYCRTVIGHPILFTMRLLIGEEAAQRHRTDAMELSVLIQLANITRDIENDLQRGVAYHPALRPHLTAPATPESTRAIATSRAELTLTALGHVPTYGHLIDDLELPVFSLARGSAVLMALHTDRHYRRMARRSGLRGWDGPDLTVTIWGTGMLAVVSRGHAARVLQRVEDGSRSAISAAGAL